MKKSDFQILIQQKGQELFRDMPWRQDTRPYYILVSELMLQQTQVERVIPKFTAFMTAFPDEASLAMASLSDVLVLWSGLGYNRRAKFLHEAAKRIVDSFDGKIPTNREGLLGLPGVGPGTAGAIMVYAFNQPIVFVETNVRTVYLHHFFEDSDGVSDKDLTSIIETTMDHDHPREFYWALMDYGSWLKRQGTSHLQRSAHYKKQPPLSGSVREVRGQIIRILTGGGMSETRLREMLGADSRFTVAVLGLMNDGLIMRTKTKLHLTK